MFIAAGTTQYTTYLSEQGYRWSSNVFANSANDLPYCYRLRLQTATKPGLIVTSIKMGHFTLGGATGTAFEHTDYLTATSTPKIYQKNFNII